MDSDKSKWGRVEWQAYALSLEAAHQDALDGWGVTVSELKIHSDTILQRSQIIADYVNLSALTVAAYNQGEQVPKRKRGRPAKPHGPLILDFVESKRSAFIAANPGKRVSDPAVLAWSFENVFKGYGLRPQRVDSTDFKKKLKTMSNVISDARVERKRTEAKHKFLKKPE